jgi:phosphoribosylformimino-5-aminoimidazole carboxamide ribonucleotide (ProFAR) isomerase
MGLTRPFTLPRSRFSVRVHVHSEANGNALLLKVSFQLTDTGFGVVKDRCCERRVGGGIRSVERARDVLAAGAHAVITSSALFRNGQVDIDFARALSEAIGADRIIAAVDSRGGFVAIHGWKTILAVTAVDAVRVLEPYCSEFLYTHVDTEGMMQGTDMAAIMAVRAATTRRLTAAGGITTWDDIDALDAAGIDAVVGMAVYTGQLPLER